MSTVAASRPSPDGTTDHRALSAELVARVERLKPLLRRNAAKGEADRRLPEESHRALADAGVLTLGLRRRFGGHEAPLRVWMDVLSAVAEGDGAAAWVAALSNSGAYTVSLSPPEAQEDVFGADPDARVCAAITPSGHSRAEDGGRRISGRWYYASGAWHATWAALAVPLTDAAGTVVDQAMALVPASDFTVEDTWFVTGMKATGSNCIVVEDAFVPEHRIGSVTAVLADQHVDEPLNGPLHRSAAVPVLSLNQVAVVLGLAREALRLVTEAAPRRGISFTVIGDQTDSASFRMQVAEAATRIDTAQLHAYRAVDDVDAAAEAGRHLDPLVRARVRADTGYACTAALDALGILMTAHGSGAFADASPLQRIWRDANVAARHGALLPGPGYEIYGAALLGRQQEISFFV